MHDVYLVCGRRTPIAKSGGAYRRIRPEVLGAHVLRALCSTVPVGREVDGVIAGNAVGTGGNIARLTALMAGLPASVPAITLDVQCASGLAAVSAAYAEIAAGMGTLYLAGGMESASLQPMRIYAPQDERHTQTADGTGAYRTAQFSPDTLSETVMLEGAERVMQAEGMTEAELCAWVFESHRRAAHAADAGVLRDLLVPIAGTAADEGIMRHMNERLLARLPRPLGKGTLTHAGNACRINDGAAFLFVCAREVLRDLHIEMPVYRIVGTCRYGGSPQESPRGAMQAAELLLFRCGYRCEDMDAIEFNEAFAAIDVLFARAYPHLTERYNVFGGALAYGHPYGASGAVILLHLMRALEVRRGRYGLVAIAGAGGMGQAMILERVTDEFL